MRRPARLRRLVIRVRPPGLPGSSGSTCCSSAALSSTTSARMPASRWRYNPVRADRSWGIWWPGTPNRRRKLSRTAAGSAGGWAGSGWKPRRLANSVWSNGCSPASRCPACTASRVLPTPAMPSIAAITTAAPLPAPWVGSCPRFGEDHAQRLVPLRYVPGVRVQRPHHGDDQVNVDPPPTGPETVHDGGLLGQLAGRTAGIGPGRVDLVLDDLVRRIASPDLERPQSLDQLVERARLPRVGQRHPRLDLLRRSHGQPPIMPTITTPYQRRHRMPFMRACVRSGRPGDGSMGCRPDPMGGGQNERSWPARCWPTALLWRSEPHLVGAAVAVPLAVGRITGPPVARAAPALRSSASTLVDCPGRRHERAGHRRPLVPPQPGGHDVCVPDVVRVAPTPSATSATASSPGSWRGSSAVPRWSPTPTRPTPWPGPPSSPANAKPLATPGCCAAGYSRPWRCSRRATGSPTATSGR